MDSKLPPQCPARTLAHLQRAIAGEDLRQLAKRHLPRAVFDFYDGGAEAERTLASNLRAFARIRFVPRSLVDVSQPDTSTTLVGQATRLPLAIAPTGAIGFGWPSGDIAIARAAQRSGIPYTLPTSSTVSIERLRQAVPDGRLWFQTYILRDLAYTDRLVERARQTNYETLVVTVDMPTGGKRERDFKNDFGLPFKFTARNALDFARHPRWLLRMLKHGQPALENLLDLVPDNKSLGAVASSVGKNYDPSFNWDGLKRLRDRWTGPFVVKGILHPADARQAAALGADGIIVSNHGGRQLDGALSSLDALADVAGEVGDKLDVLLDGGVRRGIDIVAAQALGAKAVMIGRPTLYGVCAGGEAGAARALELLEDEYMRSLRLLGVVSAQDIRGLSLLREPA